MTSSSRYWQRRTAQRVVDAEQQVLAFERSFRRQYRAAVGNIDHQITSLYRRYAEVNAMDYMEAYQYLSDSHRLEFQADLTHYIAGMKDAEYRSRNYSVLHALSTRARVRRLEAMRASIRLEAGQLYSRLGSDSERLLQDIFSEGYERTVFDTFQRLGMGVSFEQANPRLFQTLLQNPWSGREFSQKIWRLEDGFVEALESTLVRGLIQGQSIDAMATYLHVAALGNASGGNGRGGCFWQAQRLIRTEANYMLNQAAEAAYKELGVDRYQYLATLDNRTSDACQELDGKVIEVAKAVPGLNYPPLHPYCRSTTIPYFDDLEGNRIARAEDGSSYHVPGDMTFEQWREQLAAGTLVKVAEVEPVSVEPVVRYVAGVPVGMEREFASAIGMAITDGVGYITLGELDTSLLRGAFGELNTSEIILTGERYHHIAMRHPGDLKTFREHAVETLVNPTMILSDRTDPKIAIYVKELDEGFLIIAVRLSNDESTKERMNSILSAYRVREDDLDKKKRRGEVIYIG